MAVQMQLGLVRSGQVVARSGRQERESVWVHSDVVGGILQRTDETHASTLAVLRADSQASQARSERAFSSALGATRAAQQGAFGFAAARAQESLRVTEMALCSNQVVSMAAISGATDQVKQLTGALESVLDCHKQASMAAQEERKGLLHAMQQSRIEQREDRALLEERLRQDLQRVHEEQREDRKLHLQSMEQASDKHLQQLVVLLRGIANAPPERACAVAGEMAETLQASLTAKEEAQKTRLDMEMRERQALLDAEEKEKREANEQSLQAAISCSRRARIDLASQKLRQMIEQATPGLSDYALWAGAIGVPLLVHWCLLDRRVTAATAALSGSVAYLLHQRLKQISQKIKWAEIYRSSLKRLEAEPQMRVRDAVSRTMEDDRTIQRATLASSTVSNMLARIPNDLVQGDPAESGAILPVALQSLVEHVRQPPTAFCSLEAFSEIQ